jgi:hypothetical protein
VKYVGLLPYTTKYTCASHEDIHPTTYHNNNNTQLPKISQVPCHLHDLFHRLTSQSLALDPKRARVLTGAPELPLASPGCGVLLAAPNFTYLLRLPALYPKSIRSSPYRLIQKVNTHPQKCLPLSPPTSPSLTAAPRSSPAMSTAPSPCPSRPLVT